MFGKAGLDRGGYLLFGLARPRCSSTNSLVAKVVALPSALKQVNC
jgi:hypothetical protein